MSTVALSENQKIKIFQSAMNGYIPMKGRSCEVAFFVFRIII